MKLNEKIYSCRRRLGLSQEALAERLGVSRQAVGKWENGDATPEVEKLLALSRTFGVTTDWLLSEDADPPDPWPDAEKREAQGDPDAAETGEAEARQPDFAVPDRLPAVLGALVRRFGWLLGIYQAIGGLVFCLFGGLVRTVGRGAEQSIGQLLPDYGFGGATYYDAAGNLLDPSRVPPELREAVTGTAALPMSGTTFLSPFRMAGNFILAVGVLLLATGLALAWYLHRLGRGERRQ